MEIRIIDKDGVFRVSAFGLVQQGLTVYREDGGITLEVREIEEETVEEWVKGEDEGTGAEEARNNLVEL